MGTLIKNAEVFDGSGAESFESDILIENDTIAEVGKIRYCAAHEVIDASGLAVAPGFIDCHSHSDISILAAPEAFGKISQGVTTEITGNCGLSVFPVTELNREHLDELYKNYNEKILWESMDGYAAKLMRRRPAVNIAALCGHNTLRAAVCGYERKNINGHEISEMRRLLRESLAKGAFGFSTGLLYSPGKFSGEKELLAMLSETASSGKIYATHLRSEGKALFEAVSEAVSLCLETGVWKLHLSHLKTAGKDNWNKLDEVLELIKSSQSHKLGVSADRYPYIESMTQLCVILPPPFDAMDSVALQKELADKAVFKNMLTLIDKTVTDEQWENVILVDCAPTRFKKYSGKTLREIADNEFLKPSQVCSEILREDAPGALAAFRGMSPQNMKKIIALPFVCCASDENSRPRDFSIGRSHPRAFGSFPKFFKILDREGISHGEIIRKMTSLPASIFGIGDRGMIKKGCKADLVLLDLAKYKDSASFSFPHSPAEGVRSVFVNGILSFHENCVCSRAGQMLKV
ncbi:MAG: hypothetical protein A2020_02065 [Lentisphaerae bacterium GWF2_45_14]|nr:MAG: hypothetical protein A2020_02065 [Lentisphaerae bacterium GWF2_45_14]